MSRDWIQSYTGRKVTPLDLKPEQVCVEDIAHALASKCRFNGHQLGDPYSVAQHCVIGARNLPSAFKLAFLLHEVSEVYMPDIPAPIKPYVRVQIGPPGSDKLFLWSELEDTQATIVFEALGLNSVRPLIDSREVRKMDLQMLATEARDLMADPPEPWSLPYEALETDALGGPLKTWNWQASEFAFLTLFRELTTAGP